MSEHRVLSGCLAACVLAVTVIGAACRAEDGDKTTIATPTEAPAAVSPTEQEPDTPPTARTASFQTISVGAGAAALALDPESRRMYIANGGGSVSVVDVAAKKVVGTVPLDVGAHHIAVNPATKRVYVTAESEGFPDGSVFVIDGNTATVVSKIGGDYSRIGGVAVNSATNRVYVVAETENAETVPTQWERILLVIDGQTNEIVSTIPGVGRAPGEVAVNPINNRVYVSDAETDKVYVVDGNTTSILTAVTAGHRPSELDVDPAANRIYVVNNQTNDVSVIDGETNRVVDTIEFLHGVCGVSADVDEGRTYVMGRDLQAEVTRVIDAATRSIVADYEDLWSCEGFTVEPRDRRAYTIDGDEGVLNVLDFEPQASAASPRAPEKTETPSQASGRFRVIATVRVGGAPTDIAVNETTDRIFVANRDSRELSVIDGKSNTVVLTIPLEEVPYFVAVNPATNRVYTNGNYDETSVFDGDSGSKLTTVPAAFGSDAAVNSISNRVYVIFNNGSRGTLYVIDGNTDTLVTTVPVGELAGAVAVDAEANRVYVLDGYAHTVTVLDGTTNDVVTTIRFPGGIAARAIALDPVAKRAYVVSGEGVVVIDTRTDAIVTTLEDLGADWVAVDPQRDLLFVTGVEGISVIDGGTDQVIATVPVNGGPDGLAVNTVTGRIYSANQESNEIAVIE